MQAGDRGFTEVLTKAFPGSGEFEQLREQSYRRTVELFDRAKDAGRLRRDFSPHDFPLVLMANAGVVTATAGLAPTTSPRLIAYLLQAFSTDCGPLPPAPTFEEMTQVLNRYDTP
jgi:hypothetical protein